MLSRAHARLRLPLPVLAAHAQHGGAADRARGRRAARGAVLQPLSLAPSRGATRRGHATRAAAGVIVLLAEEAEGRLAGASAQRKARRDGEQRQLQRRSALRIHLGGWRGQGVPRFKTCDTKDTSLAS